MLNRTDGNPPTMDQEIEDFLLERRIRKVSKKTMIWHRGCLKKFAEYCYENKVFETKKVTAKLLRQFIIMLEEQAHNPGGIANIYRSVKAYLNWFDEEFEDLGWKNPTKKVRVANDKIEPLNPISTNDYNALIASCERKTLAGERDRTIFMMLMDTGMRKAEIIALKINDIDLKSGRVFIREGKGGKSRSVYIGAKTRRALNGYLRLRESFVRYKEQASKRTVTDALWIHSTNAKALTYSGMSRILDRRSRDAGIGKIGFHAFRRAFARNAYRSGMSLLDIQKILGHADLSVINRYIKQDDTDIEAAQENYGVVDNL